MSEVAEPLPQRARGRGKREQTQPAVVVPAVASPAPAVAPPPPTAVDVHPTVSPVASGKAKQLPRQREIPAATGPIVVLREGGSAASAPTPAPVVPASQPVVRPVSKPAAPAPAPAPRGGPRGAPASASGPVVVVTPPQASQAPVTTAAAQQGPKPKGPRGDAGQPRVVMPHAASQQPRPSPAIASAVAVSAAATQQRVVSPPPAPAARGAPGPRGAAAAARAPALVPTQVRVAPVSAPAPSLVVAPPQRAAPAPRGTYTPPSFRGAGAGGRFMATDVDVPYPLLDWAGSDEAAALFDTVLASTAGIEDISFRLIRQGRGAVHVEGISMPTVRTAAALVNLHLKNQSDLLEMRSRAEQAESDLLAAEEEIRLGLRCEFPIDPEVMGLAIGKNGANISRALETGVARVVVDKRDKVVRIRGDDPDAVFRAREIMEYQIARVAVKPEEVAVVLGPGGDNLHTIQTSSGVLNMVLEQPGGVGTPATIVVTGQRTAVEAAKLLVETQLKYSRDLQAARSRESQIMKRLHKLDADYGENEYVAKPDAGFRGPSGRGPTGGGSGGGSFSGPRGAPPATGRGAAGGGGRGPA